MDTCRNKVSHGDPLDFISTEKKIKKKYSQRRAADQITKGIYNQQILNRVAQKKLPFWGGRMIDSLPSEVYAK